MKRKISESTIVEDCSYLGEKLQLRNRLPLIGKKEEREICETAFEWIQTEMICILKLFTFPFYSSVFFFFVPLFQWKAAFSKNEICERSIWFINYSLHLLIIYFILYIYIYNQMMFHDNGITYYDSLLLKIFKI